jgi:hypothetical protein
MLTQITTSLQNLTFTLLNKLLKLILPIPLFPTVSSLLAQALHIDPLSLKPFPLPTIPVAPFAPFSHMRKPHIPDVGQLRGEFRKAAAVIESEGGTIPINEKVRTWKVDSHDAHKPSANKEGKRAEEKEGRRRIDQVEFEGAVPEIKSTIKEAKDSLQGLVPKV